MESQSEQPNTIEWFLFNAFLKLNIIKDRPSSLYSRAGRTDKGVSALGNVITLRIRDMARDGESNAEKINRLLPDDVYRLIFGLKNYLDQANR